MIVLIIAQLLFTFTALWAKYNFMNTANFADILQENWLVLYICVYVLATFMQLYVFKVTNILKAMSLFSGIGLILTIALSYILLGEIPDWRDISSIVLVITALSIISSEKSTFNKNSN